MFTRYNVLIAMFGATYGGVVTPPRKVQSGLFDLPKILASFLEGIAHWDIKYYSSTNEEILNPWWLLRKVLSTFKPQCTRDERDLKTPAWWWEATCTTNKPFIAEQFHEPWNMSKVCHKFIEVHCCIVARVQRFIVKCKCRLKWHPDCG